MAHRRSLTAHAQVAQRNSKNFGVLAAPPLEMPKYCFARFQPTTPKRVGRCGGLGWHHLFRSRGMYLFGLSIFGAV